MRKVGRSALHRIFSQLKEKGISDQQMGILIDSLWRDPVDPATATGWNETPQNLTGITPTFNPADGINAIITVSAATTITFVALIPGQGGVITVTNSGIQNITVAGSYTFKICTSLYFVGDVIETSGATNLDVLTWYYDGVRVVIDGIYNVGS